MPYYRLVRRLNGRLAVEFNGGHNKALSKIQEKALCRKLPSKLIEKREKANKMTGIDEIFKKQQEELEKSVQLARVSSP